MATAYQLLDDALVTISGPKGLSQASLPEVLAALSRDEDIGFPVLQRHQAHAWHAFLTQIAASMLHKLGLTECPQIAGQWAQGLRTLSEGDRDAWALVRDDPYQPALLQPPLPPSGKLADLKNTFATPDNLDILLTAKNFDLKCARVSCPTPELWLYALVTRQTMSGFDGSKTYGIARMNGGLSNRPCVALARDRRWATRFLRDTQVWLAAREDIIQSQGYTSKLNPMLWLYPWDGEKSIDRFDLDPFFIECCRRIRLVGDSTGLTARAGTSKAPHISLDNFKGDTGDIWTPTKPEPKIGRASLTVPFGGFGYRRLHELLFSGGWISGAALKYQEVDGDAPIVIAEAMVRGQGKTEGFYSREIRVPGKVRGFSFGSPGAQAELGKLSELQITYTKTIQSKVLKPALLCYLQGGADKLDLRDERASPWLRRLTERVDDIFFVSLFESLELPDPQASWRATLRDLAQAVFSEALNEMPVPLARRHRARALAQRLFYGALKRNSFQPLESQAKETS